MTSIIVLSHGSKLQGGNDGLFKIVEMLKVVNNWDNVEVAFLQSAVPGLGDTVDRVVRAGATRVIVFPMLLFSGSHVVKDIPNEIERQRKKHAGVEFLYAKNLGPDERIAQIAADRINHVLAESRCGSGRLGKVAGHVSSYDQNPESIARESYATIDRLLEIIGVDDVPPINLPVIKRIIHTTGDPEYGINFKIFPGAIEAGIAAVAAGKSIVTDVNMVKAGINKKLARQFGCRVVCRIADHGVALRAQTSGKTRAITAIDESTAEIDGGIVAIGNAPSALFHLIELIENGSVLPELIIGVPVGFVGAAESKDALMGMNIPYITNSGRKGGSPVAVTIVNAILNQANR